MGVRQGSLRAFTLVELIVVVTILALLSTIGFVSYSSYLSGVRDTNRLSQLVAISDGLELYRTKKTLPIPDDNIEIRANGTTIGYQGYAGINVLETIDYSKTGKNPKDKIHFSYYLTQDKKYYQLLTYLEEEENLETNLNINLLNQAKADTDYTNRYPKVSGKKLGILTQSGTNIPVQEVTALVSSGYLDIATTTDNYIAMFKDSKTVEGTGSSLALIGDYIKGGFKVKSCEEIIKFGKGESNGIYIINPTGKKEIEVYCDMKTDEGGWIKLSTLINNETERIEWATFLDTNTSNSYDTNNCPECGGFPQYLNSSGQDSHFCFWALSKLGINKDISQVKGAISSDLETHIARDGLWSWYYSGISQWVIRSESENDYTVYEEILCK